MRKKRILMLIGSVCLAMMLLVPLAVSCGPATPEEAVEEIAALEAEIDDLEGDLTAEKAKTAAKSAEVSDLEAEIAELRAPAEVYEWKFQSYIPAALAQYHLTPYIEDIESASGGRIKITGYTDSSVIPLDDTLHAVAAGTIELSDSMGVYFPDEVDLGWTEHPPMAWLDTASADSLWEWKGLHELVAESWADAGVHYLGPNWCAPYELITRQPVNSLDDLRGMKIRAVGATAKALDSIGVATTYITFGEIFTALQTGTVDGAIWGGAIEYEQMGWLDVAPYLLTTPFELPVAIAFIMNPDAWNGLPDDLKAVLNSTSYQAAWRYFSWVWSEENRVRSELREENHLTALSPEDIVELTVASVKVWEEYGATSPRSAQALEILKEHVRYEGRLP